MRKIHEHLKDDLYNSIATLEAIRDIVEVTQDKKFVAIEEVLGNLKQVYGYLGEQEDWEDAAKGLAKAVENYIRARPGVNDASQSGEWELGTCEIFATHIKGNRPKQVPNRGKKENRDGEIRAKAFIANIQAERLR